MTIYADCLERYQSQNAESGQTTPDEPYADCGDAGDRVPSPRQYRVGGLSALLMGSKYRGGHSRQGSQVDYSTQNSPTRSPSRSPYDSPRNSVFDLVASSTAAAGLASKGAASLAKDRRPGLPRSTSEDTLTGYVMGLPDNEGPELPTN